MTKAQQRITPVKKRIQIFIFEICNCLSRPIGVETTKTQPGVVQIPQNMVEFGHFTLLFFRRRLRNVQRFICTCKAIVLLIKPFRYPCGLFKLSVKQFSLTDAYVSHRVTHEQNLPSKTPSTVLDSSSYNKLFRPLHIFGSKPLAATCQFHAYVGFL